MMLVDDVVTTQTDAARENAHSIATETTCACLARLLNSTRVRDECVQRCSVYLSYSQTFSREADVKEVVLVSSLPLPASTRAPQQSHRHMVPQTMHNTMTSQDNFDTYFEQRRVDS